MYTRRFSACHTTPHAHTTTTTTYTTQQSNNTPTHKHTHNTHHATQHTTHNAHNEQHRTQNTQGVVASSAYKKFAYARYSLDPREVHQRNFGIFPTFKVENRPRTTCHRFLQIVAQLSDTAEGISCRMVRFVFRHQNPNITNDLHGLPQWLHVFCYISYEFLHTHPCHHESSRTPQHS